MSKNESQLWSICVVLFNVTICGWVGEKLSPAQVLHAQNSWVETANSFNIAVVGGTPLSTILAAANVGKEEAAGLVDKRAQLLRLESKTGSLRSVASGFKSVAWLCGTGA